MHEQSTEIVSRIWEESRGRLKGFIAKRIRNEADAEDVLQDVFFKIYRNVSELKDPERLSAWVFQTTRNAIVDFYRERKFETESGDEVFEQLAVEMDEPDIEDEVLNWLEPMIGELPAKYRDALLLTEIRGLTQKELSEKLDISVSGAKSRVQRGREQLRQTLLNCCHLEFNRAGKIVEYRPKTDQCGVCSH